MRLKMLVLVLVALACSAGMAFPQGSTAASVAAMGDKPPKLPKDDKGAAKDAAAADKAAAKDAKDAAKDAAKTTKAQTKAERAAAKELKFKTEMQRLGYSCRGGTMHVVGRVVSVTPATPAVPATPTTPAVAATPGTMVIEVTKGNSRAQDFVGTQLTVMLAASTEVKGTLPVGAIVKLDLRSCSTAGTTGVAGTSVLVARKASSKA
jgi:hypothetical protein